MSQHSSGARQRLPHLSTLIPDLWGLLTERERELLLLRGDLYFCNAGTQIYPSPTPPSTDSGPRVVMVVLGQALTYFQREGEVPLGCTGAEVLGLTKYLTGEEDHLTCRALSKCLILSLPTDPVFSTITENIKAVKLLLGKALKALAYRNIQLVTFCTRRMPGRMATTLLDLDEKFGRESDGKTLGIKLPRGLLGGLSNMTRSNATRILRSFQEDGIVALHGREIEILDEDALKEISRLG